MNLKIFLSVFLGFSLSAACIADQLKIEISTVPLFETASVYIKYSGIEPEKCRLFIKEKKDSDFREVFAALSVKRDKEFRGAVFNLKENTEYELVSELIDGKGRSLGKNYALFKTWTSNVPVGKTVMIGKDIPAKFPLEIKGVNGSADAWIKYVAAPGLVIDGGKLADGAILVEKSSYIIFEGLTVKGGDRFGFNLVKSENIRILNCDVSGWGRLGIQCLEKKEGLHYGAYYDEKKRIINYDGAINIDYSGKVVVERNYVHDPRGTANSWFYSHPTGPQAMTVRSTGSCVVRYNDFIGSDEHRWNDSIEGHGNGSLDGSFYRDSDIYGNMMAFGNDDGIELDGGQINVRFFSNKVEGFLCGISTAPNMAGPSYVYNNLVVNLADEDGVAGSVIKSGGGSAYSKGLTYFFHNTFYTNGNGISGVGYGKDEDRAGFYGISRNNILACSLTPLNDSVQFPGSDFDYDLMCNKDKLNKNYMLAAEGMESHGIQALPRFVDSDSALFSLRQDSPAKNAGIYVPGISPASDSGRTDMGIIGLIPARPVPVTLDKSQLNLTLDLKSGKKDSAIVKLSVKDGKKFKDSFRILKNDVFSWLKVEPSATELVDGKAVQLKVSLENPEAKSGSILKGLFLIKFSNGYSVPVTVYAKVFSGKFEKTVKISDMKTAGTFSPLSGESGVLLDKGGLDNVNTARYLEYSFEAPEDGTYYIFTKVKTLELPVGRHDSLYMSLDSAEPERSGLAISTVWDWLLIRAGQPTQKNRQGAFFKKGMHSIKIYPREDLAFDGLFISSDPFMNKGE